MRLILDDPERVARWVAERVGAEEFAPPVVCVGFERNGELVGGHVYEGQTQYDIRIHIAGPASVSRWGCRLFWTHVFVTCGLRRVTAIIRSDNQRMIDIVKRLGFREEGRLRGYFDTADAVLCGLLADEAADWMKAE